MEREQIEILFDSRYSEEEKQDIAETLQTQFEVRVSERVIIRKAIGIPLSILITVSVPLSIFLKGFLEEAGKLLAQKLFSPTQRYNDIDSLEIKIKSQKGEKELTVTAKDYQELYLKIKKLTQERENNETNY